VELDARWCPSVFYDFDTIAKTGQAGLTSIQSSASVNDAGKVAFVTGAAIAVDGGVTAGR